MTMIENNIYTNNEYSEIEIIHQNYRCIVKIDTEDIKLLRKVRLSNTGYACTFNGFLLHRIIMGCSKNDGLQVDHISGDILDNRKANLRVVTGSVNKRNLHTYSRNNTGTIGVQQRSNGNYHYYRVGWRDFTGTRFAKQFNIGKLGDDLAFKLATELLIEKQNEFGYI